MRVLIALLFLTIASSVLSQQSTKIPAKIRKSIPLLTAHLTADKRSDEAKVEAIHTWITENIAYDYDLLQSEKYIVGVDPSKIIKSRKALCSGYVELMRAMLYEAGIQSETVTGYIHDDHWEPGILMVTEQHAWIAVFTDGEWRLADPTWDAGYIGRIPTHKKPYRPRTYKKTTFPNKTKEKKVLAKRDKKEAARRKKYDDAPTYSKEIGFVRQPRKDYFLIHPDTFLLSHLPIDPIWQLRSHHVSIESFSAAQDELIQTLAKTGDASTAYDEKIELFKEKNYLDQLIHTGEEGAAFNPHNPAIKLLYYYNYMSLINSKNIQRLARGSSFEITPSKYPQLAAKTDTIIQYNKRFKEFEKTNFKATKEYDKIQFKESEARDKVNSRLVGKVCSEYDKLLDRLEKNTEKLESNNEKIRSSLEKLSNSHAKSTDYIQPEDFDLSIVQPWVDSIQPSVAFITERREQLSVLHSNSSIPALFSDLSYLKYLLENNADFIRFNSYSTSEIVAEIDSLIQVEATHALMLYSDSIPRELADKELMHALKKIEGYCKIASTSFKQSEASGALTYPYKYELYLYALYCKALEDAWAAHTESAHFNAAVISKMKSVKSYPADISKLMEKQADWKQEKYDYILEQTEKVHSRDISAMKKIESDSRIWEQRYSKQ